MTRISELPRRDWRIRTAPFLQGLSDLLRQPGGSQTLRPAQAAALLESAEQRGAFVNGRVGIGKSLMAALAPRVARLEEVRALILCPGGILRASVEHFAEMREHWALPAPGRYIQMSYSALSGLPARGESLGDLFGPGKGPNMLICDEADSLRNIGPQGSARARQIEEWMAEYPETIFIGVTATCHVEGLTDYAHLMAWALGDGSPLPLKQFQQEYWHEVIDRGDYTRAPWVCKDLGIPVTFDLDEIRRAYTERVHQTPGVIFEDTPYDGAELIVREHVLPSDPQVEPHFARLRDLWQRPDGADVLGTADEEKAQDPDRVQGSTIWGVARRMGRRLCYVYDPRPPEAWTEARRRYFAWVRRSGHMTELVARRVAIEQGLPEWTAWEAIRPTFTPRQKTLWLGDAALKWVEAWGREAPGVIWVDDVAFGLELSQRTGWDYFQGKGRTSKGRRIPSGKGPRSAETIIASRAACGTGLNLQYRWNRCLFTAPPTKSRDFEQNTGRFHREGQPEGQVFVDILLTCAEDRASLVNLRRSAQRTTLYSQKAALYEWPSVDCPTEGRAWS